MCIDSHEGKLDIVTATLLWLTSYAYIKSECAHAALVSDVWSESPRWRSKQIYTEFGLDQYYESFNLNLVIVLSPMIKMVH